MEYYKPDEDALSTRTIEPYALFNGREGWYVAAVDVDKDKLRHFRLDRIKDARVLDETFEPRPEIDALGDVEGWPRTGEVPASRIARVWFSPERARWAREDLAVAEELADGAVVVELPFAGTDWLVRRVLAEAGDAAVLEPADARDAVGEAVGRLRGVPAATVARTRVRAHEPARPDPHVRRGGARVPRRGAHGGLRDERPRAGGRTSCRSGTSCGRPATRARRRCGRGRSPSPRRRRTSSATPRATLQVEAGESYEQLRGVMLECDVDVHRDVDAAPARSGSSCSRATASVDDGVRAMVDAAGAQADRRCSSSSARARPGTTASSAAFTRGPWNR